MKKKQAKKASSAKQACARKRTKLVRVLIDRRTWCRGDKNRGSGECSRLLTDKNTRCCLGFDLKQRGYKDEDLYMIGFPSRVGDIKGLTDDAGEDTDICNRMMSINDNMNISDKMREYRLKQLARKIGRDYVFVN